MLGPIANSASGLLDPSVIVQHIQAPAKVFAKCAERALLTSTSSLFPSTQDDPILMALKAIPWERVGNQSEDEFLAGFARGLEIPEYDHVHRKYQLKNVSFTSPTLLNRRRPRQTHAENPFRQALYIIVGVEAYFSKPLPAGIPLPQLKDLLEKHGAIVVETRRYMKLPEEAQSSWCTKGVLVTCRPPNQVVVHEFIVDHPGTKIAATGGNFGLSYEWRESRLERRPNSDDCTCNNPERHQRHLGLLECVEWGLSNYPTRRTSRLSLHIDDGL